MCLICVDACVMVYMWRSEDTVEDTVGSHLLPFKFRTPGLYGMDIPTRTTPAFRIRRVVRGYFQDAVEAAGNQVSLARNPKERGMKGFI